MNHAPALTSHSADGIRVRGEDLTTLAAQLSFSGMLLFSLTGQRPTQEQQSIVDAVLNVALESGFTRSGAASRVPYRHSIDSLQAGTGTGLLAAGGGLFTQAEAVAHVLDQLIVSAAQQRDVADGLVRKLRAQGAVPGFGHHRFREEDPRSRALIELTADLGVPGHHLRALATLADAVEDAEGRALTVNAAAAIAAVLGEAGVVVRHFGPLAMATRAAGLAVQIVSQTTTPGSAVASAGNTSPSD